MDMGPMLNSDSHKRLPSSTTTTTTTTTKCLLFDRRYGLVYDVRKDPSEEALSGGRGMFCIVPLSKALIKSASHMINLVASSTLRILEKPNLYTPEVLQVNINNKVQRVASSLKKPKIDLPILKRSRAFSSN
ncbi:hypothetical protein ACH5RR_033662 [Cinchona calisaya]|uniref:Uncharacterized protein n=1 Tax=Cinchona calisaya TaxID=153742 RepID=A0ABD2Y9W5_9GENT